MAELLYRQTGNQLPPELRKKFSEVHHIKETGRIAIYGLDKKTKKKYRLGTREYISAQGYDPKPQQAKGIWHSGGGDRPVTIIGSYGRSGGGTEQLRAYRTKEKIPKNEVEWSAANGDSSDKGSRELKKQLDTLRSQHRELADNLKKQAEKNQDLENEKAALQARLDSITSGYLAFEPRVSNRATHSRPKRLFNQSAGWIGSKLPRRARPAYSGYTVEEREDGPVMVATEERVDGFSVEDRRRGAAAAAGALAAVGAVVLVAWLWGEHEEHEGPKPTPAVTLPATPHIEHDNTAGVGHRHQGFFHGGKAFKVSLPGNLDWEENDNGSYRIDDIAGHHIVPHVYWDQQGNLDPDSKQLLLTTPYHHFKLKQDTYDYHTPGTDFDHHYQTVVENQ